VAAVVIAEMEKVAEGGCSLCLGAVGPDVDPIVEHRAVEALDLAVGLWPVGLGEPKSD
jgi:hypothetical protein